MGRWVSDFRKYERWHDFGTNDSWASVLYEAPQSEIDHWEIGYRYGDANVFWLATEWDGRRAWLDEDGEPVEIDPAPDYERTAWLIRNECGDEAVVHYLTRKYVSTWDIDEWGSSKFIKRYATVARYEHISEGIIADYLPDLDADAVKRVLLYVSRWRKHREQELADQRAAEAAGWEAERSVAPRLSDEQIERRELRNKHSARVNKTNALAKLDKIVSAAKKASLAMHPHPLLSRHG